MGSKNQGFSTSSIFSLVRVRATVKLAGPRLALIGRNSRFPTTVQEYDRSADILVRFDHVGKPQADKNVRAPIT